MKKKHMFGCFILSLCLLLSLTGCTPQAEPHEIVIGVAWPFAAENNLFNEGIDLAVQEINASGGISGKTLKLLKEDDGSEVVKGIAIAYSLAENKSVLAVIGHRDSFVSIPASSIYEQAGVVMLSTASTAPELTQNNYGNIFRNLPGDDEIARQLAKHLSDRGLKRLVIYYSSDAYGTGLANAFEDAAKALGVMVVDRFNYYSGLEDLLRLHDRWQAFGFDGIFVASSSAPDGARFISDARQIGIQAPFAAGDSLDSPKLNDIAWNAAEGTVVGSVFDPASNRPEVKRFVAAFQKAYLQTPTSDAALGYDAVHMLAAAIENASKPDRTSIANELSSLGKWTGVCGVHELSPSGDDLGDLVVLKKLWNGSFISLEK